MQKYFKTFKMLKRDAILVRYGCHNKIPQAGYLQQKKLIFSQFWRPEVQDQGIGSIGFSQGLSGL